MALLLPLALAGCPKAPLGDGMAWNEARPLVVPGLPAPACSRPQPVALAIHEYAVKGRTIEEVTAWMADHGPGGSEGKRWSAHTDLGLAWGCRKAEGPPEVNLTVTLTVGMPRWDRPAKATLSQAEWDAMNAKLLDHEFGHVRIGVEGFQCVDLGAAQSCADVDAALKARLAEVSARNSDYDALNGHGTR